MEVVPKEMMDLILTYGAVPVLCVISWLLWKKTEVQSVDIAKLNEDHKTDIKNGSDEGKALQQNTLNTINEFANEMRVLIDYVKNK